MADPSFAGTQSPCSFLEDFFSVRETFCSMPDFAIFSEIMDLVHEDAWQLAPIRAILADDNIKGPR
jgi:hypothetical protein